MRAPIILTYGLFIMAFGGFISIMTPISASWVVFCAGLLIVLWVLVSLAIEAVRDKRRSRNLANHDDA